MGPIAILPESLISTALFVVVLGMVWMCVAVGSQILVQVVAKKQLSRWTSGIIATVVVVAMFLINIARALTA